jgi:hypothetical protein
VKIFTAEDAENAEKIKEISDCLSFHGGAQWINFYFFFSLRTRRARR